MDFSLSRITFLNTSEKLKLGKAIENAEAFSKLTLKEISSLVNRDFSSRVKWDGVINLKEAEKEFERCRKLKIDYVRVDKNEYPAMLRTIQNPPYMIFYRGSLDAFLQKSVSVVGTRNLTAAGKVAAFEFSKAAALNGVSVVSGLARGADSFAHKGALDVYFDAVEKKSSSENYGRTIAVLPSAIDHIVPAGNIKLAEDIIRSGGCIISEYAPGTPSATWHFVQRNRIIAALSPATVVIEAPNGSGALITVDFALEFGRDVMFHETCFSEAASKINERVKQNLKMEYNNKQISRHKLEVSSEQYVRDGAPVIKDYEDYCRALEELPGTRSSNKIIQLNLFD